MSNRVSEEVRVVNFFRQARLDSARSVLAIVRAIVREREGQLAQPPKRRARAKRVAPTSAERHALPEEMPKAGVEALAIAPVPTRTKKRPTPRRVQGQPPGESVVA